MSLRDRLRPRRPPATTVEADRLALRQLAARGADLTRPRHVVHFLAFAEEAAARAAVADVTDAGYEPTVSPPDGEQGRWLLRAEAHRVVDPTTVPGFRDALERISAAHGGEYEGWEAAREP